MGGFVCEFFNAFVFGFTMEIHFILRFLLLLAIIIFLPPIALIAAIFWFSGGAVVVFRKFIAYRSRWSCFLNMILLPVSIA
jgi:hypothetical protein